MAGDEIKERAPLNPSARSSARLGLGEVDVIAPGVIHVRFAGAIRPEHIEPMMQAGDEQIALGNRVLIVIDADDVHGYKSEVRKIFQAWMRRNKANLEKVWVLFRSPLIKMGIGMVNAVTGGSIRAFSDPDEFDAELSQATRRAREGWLSQSGTSAHAP
jgi:hypothetical protein